MALFGFGRSRLDEADRARVTGWAREAGGWDDEVVVKVNEIVCPDPACPGMETIVLVMAPGRQTRAYKLAKPLDTVTREDVADALRVPG